MSTRQRFPAEERRHRILEAVIPVFAEKGFHGATTRDLADAAGVSEALLYRHFPSKESMFQAIFDHHLETRLGNPETEATFRIPPSTEKLVKLFALLFQNIAAPEDGNFARLVLRSLLSDGKFSRTVLGTFRRDFWPMFADSLTVAAEAGDLVEDVARDLPSATSGIWFTHHLAAALKFFSLAEEQVVPYETERGVLLQRALRFALRGLGLRDEAIQRHLGSLADAMEDSPGSLFR